MELLEIATDSSLNDISLNGVTPSDVSSNDISTNCSTPKIKLLNEVYLIEDIASTNGIRSKSYNSSPWNGDQNNFVKFKSDKVILHEDDLVREHLLMSRSSYTSNDDCYRIL